MVIECMTVLCTKCEARHPNLEKIRGCTHDGGEPRKIRVMAKQGQGVSQLNLKNPVVNKLESLWKRRRANS